MRAVSVSILVLVFMLMVFGRSSWFCVYGASENDAAAAILAAEGRIGSCYGAAAEADAAGANVTNLMDRLNEAGLFLSKAELSYRSGDFDSTIVFANQGQAVLDGFVEEAEALTDKAVQAHFFGLLVFWGSAVGTAGVVCGGPVVWFLLKKREETGGVVE